jgi:molecular chaperone GrpE
MDPETDRPAMTDETAPNEPISVDAPPPAEDAAAAKLAAAEKQLNDYKLLVAELQTSMRRVQESARQERRYAHEPLVKDLLPALDNLDRALDALKKAGDDGPLTQGVAGTQTLILDALKRHGVAMLAVGPGTPFDPMKHQAVMEQPTQDLPPGSVATVLQSGFVLHDRVLRPATVTVAKEG